MVDINVQAASWPAPTQYIQSVIDGESAGTTFLLKAGVHRMQTIEFRTGDTLNFEAGAILRGSQDIKGKTWTKDGGNARWYCTLTDLNASLSGTFRTNGSSEEIYQRYREWPILDGNPCPFVALSSTTSISDVDPDTAYYDSGADRLYIGIDPATLTTIELARQQVCMEAKDSSVTGVTIKGDRAQPGIIENYASNSQSEHCGLKIGRRGNDEITDANWVFQDLVVRNFRGMAIAHGDLCLISRIDVHHCGQIGIGGTRTYGSVCEYSSFTVCAIGGWSSGWEAGNTKWAHVDSHINRGCWYDSAALDAADLSAKHPHMSITGPLWYDIDNDDVEIFRCHVLDRTRVGGRGFFWEISWGVNFHNNILYGLAWEAGNASFLMGIIISTAGPYASSVLYPGQINDNILYECSGGVRHHGSPDRGSGDQGKYWCQNFEHNGNAIQISDSSNFPNTGSARGIHGTDVPSGFGNGGFNYSKNFYVAPSLAGGHWRKDVDDGDGDGYGVDDFDRWQTEIEPDAVAFTRDLTNPKVNIFPYRGGAL
jgi:hypothetical protein